MRIIKNPSNKLGARGGASLMKYVEAALNKDKDYFDFFDNLRNLLSGKHWENVTKARPKQELKMVVNLAHAHVRSMVPTLFFKDPQTDCLPTMQQHVGKEKTWNAIINNTLEKIGFKKEFKKAVLDAVTYPEAVIKDVVNRSPEEDQSDQSEQDYKGLQLG